MSSDSDWNKTQPPFELQHPSEGFADRVMQAIEALPSSPLEQGSEQERRPQSFRSRSERALGAELLNVVLASAATFLFVTVGGWSELLTLQGGQFGLAVQEAVAHTVFTGMDWVAGAFHAL